MSRPSNHLHFTVIPAPASGSGAGFEPESRNRESRYDSTVSPPWYRPAWELGRDTAHTKDRLSPVYRIKHMRGSDLV